MSITPSDDYITATKLIESFSCFFEKINNASTGDIPLNAQKLTDLKKILYSNIYSPETILSATEELYGNNNHEELLLSPTKTLVTVRSLEQSQRLEPTSEFCAPRNFFSVQPFEASHLVNQEGDYEEKSQLNTEYLPATSFLALVKAACHNDMSKLFSLSSNYAYIRTFADHQQSVFTALCFAFLEKLVREKGRDSQFYLTQGHHQKKTRADPVIAQEAEFLHFFKTFCQNTNEGNLNKKLYEAISNNDGFYTSALSIFKQHITRVVLDRLSVPASHNESFEWMNDLDEVEDTSFFQGLTKVFKCNIKFLILTRVKLIERMFYCDNAFSQSDVTLTVFYDKASKMSFILYPKDNPTEEESESTYQRVKARPTVNTNFNAKPSLNNDSLKSLKNFGVEYPNGSLTTLDTVNTITSLNELENKDRPKNIAPTRAQQLKKANTINVFTASLNDHSPCFTYPESALLRPSTEKVSYAGFSSASKDLEYYRTRTDEDLLVRKDREPVPTRPGSFFDYSEPTMTEDRQFGQVASRLDFSKQYLNTVMDEPRLSREAPERSTYIDRSPQRESISLRAYMSETKSKNDDYLFNRACSIDNFSTRVKSHNDMVAMSIRPLALPILLKSKFDRFNHTLNQNDQEVANTVARHANGDINVRDYKPKAELGNIMNTYQMIIGAQSQESNRCRPSIVTMLRMDR